MSTSAHSQVCKGPRAEDHWKARFNRQIRAAIPYYLYSYITFSKKNNIYPCCSVPYNIEK